MQRGTLNLVLAAALAALGALAWFKPGADDPAGTPAFGALEGLAAIEVTRTDGAGFALARGADGRWALTAPFALPADQAAVDALLGQLREQRARARYPAASLDLAQLGLATPSLTLVLGAERYAFGGTDPIDYRRYVQHGDEVLLVDELISFRLRQDASDLADRRLLPEGAKVVGLALPGHRLTAQDGRWTIAPDAPGASADAPVALAEAWQARRADRVAVRGSAPTQARIEVTLAGASAPLVFEVLTASDGLRLARPDLGVEYSLPASARAALLELAPAPPPAAR
jgi:hypothetical protein